MSTISLFQRKMHSIRLARIERMIVKLERQSEEFNDLYSAKHLNAKFRETKLEKLSIKINLTHNNLQMMLNDAITKVSRYEGDVTNELDYLMELVRYKNILASNSPIITSSNEP